LNLGVTILLLLLIGSITAILSKRFKIAYTKLLVIIGVAISIAHHVSGAAGAEPTGELILTVILPPLVFQAALIIDHAVFKKVQKTAVLLAIVSVAISAIVCSLVVSSLTPLSFIAALAFGVIISPTDTASVVDTLKRVKAPKELATIIEGESLLNDATALALFSAVSTLTLSPIANAVDIAAKFVGGAIVGLVLAFIANRLTPFVNDENARVMITISLAYGSYVLASTLGLSGIVAVAVLGLYIGEYYKATRREELREDMMLSFWNLAAFVANTAAFMFIGLASNIFSLLQFAPLIILSFAATLVARYVSIQAVIVPASRLTGAIPQSWRNVICLGGIRGAVSAAMALALPEFPFKNTVVTVTFGVIFLSLLVQTWLFAFYTKKALR